MCLKSVKAERREVTQKMQMSERRHRQALNFSVYVQKPYKKIHKHFYHCLKFN